MTRPAELPANYPGGFAATEILVLLYSDGRTNFILTRFDNDKGRQPLDAVDQQAIASAVASRPLDVSGMEWGDLITAANAVADDLRGCTWEDFVRKHNPPPTRHDARVRDIADKAAELPAEVSDADVQDAFSAELPADDPDAILRAMWTEQGVSQARQEEILAEITAKAQPGAKVGPFTIGGADLSRPLAYREELTPVGIQYVIPGCERDAPKKGRHTAQLALW